ncbi:hypothetical protein DRO28_02655, partial [Candidatus Bathyarchaeota archaeon]
MTESFRFQKVLADVKTGVYVRNYRITNEELGMDCRWFIEKRRLEGGVSDGVDIVTVDNGALSFTIVPTRGMGIWKGEFKGLQLGWKSPVENLVHPHYINLETRGGMGWLYGFNEWIVRCGLESFGPPGVDVITDEEGHKIEVPLTLHGRIANIPADTVKVRAASGSTLELEVEGTVYERTLFGPSFKLTNLTSTSLNSNTVRLTDVIENLKSTIEEMQVLYHCNYGVPFLEEGARVVAPFKTVAPRDASSVEELPCFTIWKHTDSWENGYVTGLEPGTSFPNLKTFERKRGRVVKLGAGQKYEVHIEFSVHLGREEVDEVKDRIEGIAGRAKTKVYKKPNP